MKNKLLSTLFLASLSFPSFADSAFDGPYVMLGLGLSSNSAQLGLRSAVNQVGTTSDLGSSGNFSGQLAVGYSYGNKNLNLAGNVFMNIGSSKLSDVSDSVNNINASSKLNKVWGVVLEPGVYLGDKALAYGKVGWARSSLETNTASSLGLNQNTNGFLFGGGVKFLATSNITIGAEFYKINFSDKSSGTGVNRIDFSSPSQIFAGLTLGYKF